MPSGRFGGGGGACAPFAPLGSGTAVFIVRAAYFFNPAM